MLILVKNLSAGAQGVHCEKGLVWIQPRESKRLELTDEERKRVESTPGLACEQLPAGEEGEGEESATKPAGEGGAPPEATQIPAEPGAPPQAAQMPAEPPPVASQQPATPGAPEASQLPAEQATPDEIRKALARLDHGDDDDWTAGGLPTIAAVQEYLPEGRTVTRASITAANADFKRKD